MEKVGSESVSDVLSESLEERTEVTFITVIMNGRV